MDSQDPLGTKSMSLPKGLAYPQSGDQGGGAILGEKSEKP